MRWLHCENSLSDIGDSVSRSSHRLGIVGSSGGSALIAADQCLREAGIAIEWVVVSDRDCRMADWARSQGHLSYRLGYSDAQGFSTDALEVFKTHGCSQALLFYTRRVAAPLIEVIQVCNIHPALLPAFVGLNAVVQAESKGVKIYGVTLHRVDAGLDTGPILAQVADLWPEGQSLELAQHLSFYQKVWLTLVWVQCCIQGASSATKRPIGLPGLALSSAGLADERLFDIFCAWLKREEIAWGGS
jgi:phosphoribosylglycinamide formyltransferase 1